MRDQPARIQEVPAGAAYITRGYANRRGCQTSSYFTANPIAYVTGRRVGRRDTSWRPLQERITLKYRTAAERDPTIYHTYPPSRGALLAATLSGSIHRHPHRLGEI